MNFPIPHFIPVPGAETMQLISIILLIVGVLLIANHSILLILQEKIQ